MRNILNIIIICCLVSLSTFAQETNPESVESRYAYKTYTPQITAPGAENVSYMATTTTENESTGSHRGPRKAFDTPEDPNQSNESPIGDAVLPLVLLALAFGGASFLRKHRNREITR